MYLDVSKNTSKWTRRRELVDNAINEAIQQGVVHHAAETQARLASTAKTDPTGAVFHLIAVDDIAICNDDILTRGPGRRVLVMVRITPCYFGKPGPKHSYMEMIELPPLAVDRLGRFVSRHINNIKTMHRR